MRKIPKMKLKSPEEITSDGEMFLQMQYMAQRAVDRAGGGARWRVT